MWKGQARVACCDSAYSRIWGRKCASLKLLGNLARLCLKINTGLSMWLIAIVLNFHAQGLGSIVNWMNLWIISKTYPTVKHHCLSGPSLGLLCFKSQWMLPAALTQICLRAHHSPAFSPPVTSIALNCQALWLPSVYMSWFSVTVASSSTVLFALVLPLLKS